MTKGSVVAWEGGITKGHKETFAGGRYVHHLDGGDDFTGGYRCQSFSSCTF